MQTKVTLPSFDSLLQSITQYQQVNPTPQICANVVAPQATRRIQVTTPILKQFFATCAYPNDQDVLQLCQQTGLTTQQVKNWLCQFLFSNKDRFMGYRARNRAIIMLQQESHQACSTNAEARATST